MSIKIHLSDTIFKKLCFRVLSQPYLSCLTKPCNLVNNYSIPNCTPKMHVGTILADSVGGYYNHSILSKVTRKYLRLCASWYGMDALIIPGIIIISTEIYLTFYQDVTSVTRITKGPVELDVMYDDGSSNDNSKHYTELSSYQL